ncbi:MAG TPA: metalloregulator ArsR/SmtB family transcription factor [Candidatus Onthovivens sp.]|nr:metalloregulator ArsR/SmtB family transcription factor [Candidatus Onthovivens sp.]
MEKLLRNTDRIFEVSDFFKMFGDPTRLQILITLLEGELCVNDIATKINMTKSAVSHQLKSLKLLKIIKYRKDGKNVFYSLDDEHVYTILEVAFNHLDE